jgi:hypothetical protein
VDPKQLRKAKHAFAYRYKTPKMSDLFNTLMVDVSSSRSLEKSSSSGFEAPSD